ncbi:MAG: hypothetical protein AB1609_16005 [Bacillota bacterium]
MHFLLLDNVHAENKAALTETLQEWAKGETGFADARLRVLARAHGMPVCTVNAGDFPGVRNSFTRGPANGQHPTRTEQAPGTERQSHEGSVTG